MEIKITLTEFDYKVLQHELLSIEEWSQLALNGKINNVKKRLLKEAQEALIADEEISTIPATTDGLLALYFSRPYYKNRQQREAEEQSEE
mgnify:CR=1 FL=1|tara:strand:+ start:5838 stop:6107 length:270 start_codon:yes stop_codon:yes gene_type:complete